MSVISKKVSSKDDLMKFIQFSIDIYKGNEYFVPPLIYDEKATLNRSKNPAFDHCVPTYFLAYRDGEIVGRIAVIINDKATERWNQKHPRFRLVDFIYDEDVVDSLF